MRETMRWLRLLLRVVVLSFAPWGVWSSALAAGQECNLLTNGGFEHVGHLSAKRLEAQTKAGLAFEGADPLLPLCWRWDPHGAVEIRLVPGARSGKQALRVVCPKSSLNLESMVIEVVPGATYSFGGWARGAGNSRMAIYGNAYEGRRELAGADLALKPEWTETRQKVTIPGNIRTITVAIAVWNSAEAFLDDLFFSAEVAPPFDVAAALTTKFKADDHTLMLVDFDGQGEYRQEGGAKLTDENGGRFGRGVRVSEQDVSSVVIPLTRKQMPPEGTLEFWFSPDDDPQHPTQYMTVLAGEQDVMHLDTHETLRLRWRTGDGDESQNNLMWCDPNARRVWIRKGEWHHVAIQWDEEAVRLFVDGGLVNYSTARPLPFFKTPSAIQLGGRHILNAWSGVVDEVRLSDIGRYGPVVPVGATWRPLPVAAQAAAEKPAATPPANPAPDFAKERKALIGPLPPPPPGAFAFDASQARPLVRDDPDFAILANTPIQGMTVAKIGTQQVELLRVPDNDGGYWRVAGIPAGSYYVGVWYESSEQGLEAPQRYRGAVMLYLNGRALQLSTHSDPIQVAPGLYYAEAQSAATETLRNGDEIAVLAELNRPLRLARLTLYPKEPARGRGWMFENYGASIFARDTFAILPDSRRYSIEVKVSALNPPSLGWPAADTISFFRGIRQSVPWPDPFANEFRRGLAFSASLPGVRQSVSLLATALPGPGPRRSDHPRGLPRGRTLLPPLGHLARSGRVRRGLPGPVRRRHDA